MYIRLTVVQSTSPHGIPSTLQQQHARAPPNVASDEMHVTQPRRSRNVGVWAKGPLPPHAESPPSPLARASCLTVLVQYSVLVPISLQWAIVGRSAVYRRNSSLTRSLAPGAGPPPSHSNTPYTVHGIHTRTHAHRRIYIASIVHTPPLLISLYPSPTRRLSALVTDWAVEPARGRKSRVDDRLDTTGSTGATRRCEWR